jgi:hypothetical protein
MKKETKEEYALLAETARELLRAINKMGYTCKDIEQGLDGRVSYRTLYRWMNGDSVPKRKKDVAALALLYKKYQQEEK